METEKIGYVDDSWNVGMRRVNKIIEEEEANGYPAFATGMYTKLPDIVVFDYDPFITCGAFVPMVRVYESTNYKSPDFYISRAKAERYLNTLLQFKCDKVMVVSFESNLLDGKEYFEKHGIEVQVRGYQD